MNQNHLSGPSDPSDSGQSRADQPEVKNVFSRDLPKPVVWGFVAILVLSVVIPGGYSLIKRQNERREADAKALQDYQRSVERAELRQLRRQLEQQRVREWEPLGEGTFTPVDRIVDPVLDNTDFNQVTASEFERWIEAEPGLLSRRNQERWTLAHVLVSFGRDDLLKVLIENKGKIDGVNEDGISPLHLIPAAWEKGLAEPAGLLASAKLLLADGADPNLDAPDIGSPTALAANLNDSALLDLMIEHGGDKPSGVPPLIGLPVDE